MPPARSSRPRDERVWNLTVADVAKQWACSEWQVRKVIRDGQLEHFQAIPGGSIRTCQEAVNDYVAKHVKRGS